MGAGGMCADEKLCAVREVHFYGINIHFGKSVCNESVMKLDTDVNMSKRF